MSFLLRLLSPLVKWTAKKAAKQHLPAYEGARILEGLQDSVSIVRDSWAVPHIEAKHRQDMFLAQGWVQAQDRLWQMDLLRRAAWGRLSEVFAARTLDSDRLSRRLGFGRMARHDAQRWRSHAIWPDLEAFTKGVNQAMQEQAKAWPAEFKLLRYQPHAWSCEDSLAIARLLAFQMSYGWAHQLVKQQFISLLPPSHQADLNLAYPSDNPLALAQGIETYERIESLLKAFEGPFLGGRGASNNWVVSKEKSRTGGPWLCNDPHLLLNLPSIWYENHLIAPDFEVSGVSIPGCPLVLIGHNRNLAWGCTLSFAHAQDLFEERLNAAKHYAYGSQWLQGQNYQEVIDIKGGKPWLETVIETHHGPIISDVQAEQGPYYSLCSPCLQADNDMLLGFYALNQASDWNDFFTACSQIHAPSLNMAYADTLGNIGYVMTGRLPLANRPDRSLAAQGWQPEQDWQGFVPLKEMPHALNPPQGYFYTCNHKIVGEDYPHDLGQLWMNGFRAKRLQQLFEGDTQFDGEDFARWQVDLHCLPAIQMRNLIRKVLPQPQGQAWALWEAWDAWLGPKSQGGAVYQVWRQKLLELLLQEALGKQGIQALSGQGIDGLLAKFNEFFSHDTSLILRLLAQPDSPWWGGQMPQKIQTALDQTAAYLHKTLGSDPKNWQWGRLHQLVLGHTLGQAKPLDELFNLGPFALGGDADTLCQLAHLPAEAYGGNIMGPSYRQIIDLSDLAKAQNILPSGQSGNRSSLHYGDQLPLWLKGQYKPMIWTSEQIQNFARYRCELRPR